MRNRFWTLLGAVGLGALLAASTAMAQGQMGTISGRVTEQATGSALPGVRVFLGGTNRSVVTNAEGRFTLPNVPAGTHEVRVSQIGYSAASQSVTVEGGATAEVAFALKQTAVQLDALLVTASGAQQAARENPASVSTVGLEEATKTAPITNMADALNARGGGVMVMPSSGTTGAGARVRIRGANSVSLGNEPVIVVDGIRVESGANSNSVGVGGQVPSRINDLNPDDIESYQVIKGPASSALYGTSAANGILEFRTKRGRPGPARWNAWGETGTFPHYDQWPNNVFGFDPTKSGAQAALRYGCTLNRVALGQCTQGGGLFILNPLLNDSPFRDGSRYQYGLNVSGGTEQTTYYVSGEAQSEDGVYKTSDLTRYSLRANITNRPSEKLDLAVSTGYSTSDLRLPDNDNNALGFLGSGLLGGSDTTRRGWGFLLPEESYNIITLQGVERFTGSLTADARPFSFLTARAVVGMDVTNRVDSRTFPPNVVPFNTTSIQGNRAANPVQNYAYTANFSASARFDLSPTITSTTTAGTQYFRERALQVSASGQKLASGVTSLNGIVVPTVDEENQEARTFGLFVEEQLGIKNRLFITAAIRGDDNSAFGQDFDFITYPKIGASWVISEEPFFPSSGMLSSLRLRSAWGQSGLQPGVTDALLYYDPVAVTADGSDQVGFTFGSLGNATLKPERSREFEVGFDAGLFDDKLRLELTYYDKVSKDALINRPLAPSLGVSNAQFYNLGSVSNKGIDITVSGRALDTPNLAVDFTLSMWGNKNRLIELGTDFLGNQIPPIIFGTQRHVEGFPLGGYWVRRHHFNDVNGDNIISQTEVTLDPDFSYMGTPFPTQGLTLNTGITLARRVRINGLLDYRSGHKLYNLTGDFRCRQNVCPEATDPSTPLATQAGMIAAVFFGQPEAYVEDASFLKLREISVTFYAPAAWARAFRGSELSLTLAGRNLATWTDYSGFDPEVNQNAQANFTTTDFLTQPPVRFFSARINVNF
jgi:TonB-linked SusC/RagA family outer membrane protein